MFGMGGSEIIVILIVALIFLGPDKLPGAAKSISKGIRDIKKQSRSLQQQIESDEQIGGAIRDLKSALRGEELPTPAKRLRPPIKRTDETTANTIEQPALAEGQGEDKQPFNWLDKAAEDSAEPVAAQLPEAEAPRVTLPASAGEADPGTPASTDDGELAAMVKPASGTIAKGS